MSVSKDISTFLGGAKTDAVAEEKKVVQLFDNLGHTIVNDSTTLYNNARAAALATNTEVSKLKALLQAALVKSSDAHQQAILLGNRLLAEAEEEIAKVKQQISSHIADEATQTAQIVKK